MGQARRVAGIRGGAADGYAALICYNLTMSDLKTLQSVCPCCQAVLTIDPETGDVLMHKEPTKKGPVMDLGEAVKSLKKDADKRDEIFKKSMDEEKRKGDILKKKFDEAFKRAQENPDEKPKPRDIDLD